MFKFSPLCSEDILVSKNSRNAIDPVQMYLHAVIYILLHIHTCTGYVWKEEGEIQ